jgi:hypothetical protein
VGIVSERQVGRRQRFRGSLAALVVAGGTLVPVTLALTPSETSASPLPGPCQRSGPIGETLVLLEGAANPVAASVGDDLSGFWSGVNGIYAIPNAVACVVGFGL